MEELPGFIIKSMIVLISLGIILLVLHFVLSGTSGTFMQLWSASSVDAKLIFIGLIIAGFLSA